MTTTTESVARRPQPWGFRVRTAPELDTPFDDDPLGLPPARPGRTVRAATSHHAGTQAEPHIGTSPEPAGARDGFPVASGNALHPQTGAPRLPAGAPGPAAARYVQVCLEVLNGFRPHQHLRTLTGPVEFDDIVRQLRQRRNLAPGPQGRSGGSGAASTRGPMRTRRLFRLRRLRVSETLPGIAEAVAVLGYAGRALALAMRLEARGTTWVCTLVQVV